MKRGLLNIMLTALAAASLAGCVYDNLVQIEAAEEPAFDESDIMDVPLYVTVTGFTTSSSVSTRDEEPAGETEEMTEFEKEIDNIWVFQFNSGGNLLIKPRRYTAEKNEADGVWTVVLKPNVKSMIHVVANVTNGESWAEDYQYFATVEALLAQTIPSPFPVIFGTEEGLLPMEGAAENVTVEGDGTVEVPVASMYAKLKAKVVFDSELLSSYEPAISAVRLSNIPWYCRVGTLYNKETMSDPAAYPSGSYWISRAIGGGNDPDDDGYDYVFYIPENIQGEKTNETNDTSLKTELAPDNATILTVDSEYIDVETDEFVPISYAVCPGGNNYNNYNIRRNCVYRITLNLGRPEETDGPSGNSIVATPGRTVSFEPYYRTETGGGYKFSNYLNWEEEDKRIGAVKILWQTEDCIGDNTKGDLVYFKPLTNSTEQDMYSRIYVKVKNAGNAVIAAYNADPDDDPSAKILWSWHIWAPEEGEDPANEAKGVLYYTYEWDEDGIYGRDSGRSRIPGYTMMNLNLGALRSIPANQYDKDVLGMSYQWGRKDPFPPLDLGDMAHNYTSKCNGYGNDYVGPLYDNEYKEINLTAKETVDDGKEYLFHSVSGNTIMSAPETYGVDYTIAHPTEFMCGTYYADATDYDSSFDNSSGTAYYHNSGDWLAKGYSDNELWGALDPADYPDMKRYAISSSIHLYDDYGEKSIFDPCPYGWRVSPPDQWLGFTATGDSPSSYADINTPANSASDNTTIGYGMYLYVQYWREGVTSFFPTGGMRIGDGCGYRQYICGNYHNASADDSNRVNILHIHDAYASFKIFESNFGYTRKSVAANIRCVRTER